MFLRTYASPKWNRRTDWSVGHEEVHNSSYFFFNGNTETSLRFTATDFFVVRHRCRFEAMLYLAVLVLCSNNTFVAEMRSVFLQYLSHYYDIRSVVVYESLILHRHFPRCLTGRCEPVTWSSLPLDVALTVLFLCDCAMKYMYCPISSSSVFLLIFHCRYFHLYS
jgi:hypothetical protein